MAEQMIDGKGHSRALSHRRTISRLCHALGVCSRNRRSPSPFYRPLCIPSVQHVNVIDKQDVADLVVKSVSTDSGLHFHPSIEKEAVWHRMHCCVFV